MYFYTLPRPRSPSTRKRPFAPTYFQIPKEKSRRQVPPENTQGSRGPVAMWKIVDLTTKIHPVHLTSSLFFPLVESPPHMARVTIAAGVDRSPAGGSKDDLRSLRHLRRSADSPQTAAVIAGRSRRHKRRRQKTIVNRADTHRLPIASPLGSAHAVAVFAHVLRHVISASCACHEFKVETGRKCDHLPLHVNVTTAFFNRCKK
uniref:SWIM-type domain-containing protein n=1 Tax=Steinernema glaseri TaxID=37863 RepID=A0A1I7Y5D9_9BILA